MKKKAKNKKTINPQNEMLKIKIRLFLFSIIFLLVALFMNELNVFRLVLCLFSILILTFMSTYNNTKHYKYIPIYLLFYVVLFILIDNVIVCTFNKVPIFSYNIITTKEARVYNALGLRVWQCDKDNYKNLIVDPFYKNGYSCDASHMDAIDSNSFLNSVIENYSEYKNNFVKVYGKISKKQGQTYIEMQTYDASDIDVNGYVKFANNITLRIVFNKQEDLLDEYDVYDNIMVVGIIRNMESSNGKNLIYMSDSKILSTISYTKETKCLEERLVYTEEKSELYSYCINNIYVTFNEDVYELSATLSSSKLNIEDLLVADEILENENKDQLYKSNGYNILVCNKEYSNKIVIGHEGLDFENYICPSKTKNSN